MSNCEHLVVKTYPEAATSSGGGVQHSLIRKYDVKILEKYFYEDKNRN